MFHLLLGGDKPPRALPASGAFTLGSAASCDLVLDGDGIDPEHARLECSAGGVRVVDLASASGTRVNGNFVSRKDLEPGDRIQIGSHLLGFVPASGVAAPSAPAPRMPAPRSRSRGGRPRISPPSPASAPAKPPRPAVPPKPAPSAPTPKPDGAGPTPAAPAVSTSAPPRPPRKRKSTALLVAGGALLLLVVAVLVVALSGDDLNPPEARSAYDRAAGMLAQGDLDRAEAAFGEVSRKWPQSDFARRATEKLQGIQRDREQDAEAREAMEAIWADRDRVGQSALLARLRKLEDEFRLARVMRELRDYERRLGLHYQKVGLEALNAARREATKALDEGGFMAALVVWREYYRQGEHIPKRPKDAQVEVERILDAAESVASKALGAAKEKADDGEFDAAVAVLEDAEKRLQGTKFAPGMRLAAESVLARRAASRGEEAPPAVVDTAERREALESLQEAELLARARRYAEAAEAYRGHLEATKDEALRRDMAGRLGELTDLAFLMGQLRKQITELPDRFLAIPLGGTIKGRATAADENGFELSLTGGRSRMLWRRIDDRRMRVLFLRLKLEGDGLAAMARFLFLAGYEDEAHATLAEASEKGAPGERIDEVLARRRRMEVPEGGFVLYRKRWYTPAEAENVALRDRIAKLARSAASSDRRKAEAAMQELREIGEAARPALIEALSAVRVELKKQMFSMAAGNPAMVSSLVRDLKAARTHALSLIYDTKKYPYNRGSANPYGPNGKEVQKDVDERVAKVRAIWEDPLGRIAEKWPDLAEVLERLRDVDTEIADLSGTPPELPKYLAEARDRIGLAAAANGKSHQKSMETMQLNASMVDAVNAEERACILAANHYRMMMGLRAVGINTALVKASRGHSEEMADLKYFAHESPTPENRTPAMRARNAEFKGGGVSENIAMGSNKGVGAHRQWCSSSGHHRNILGKGHTVVGVGQGRERYWTQMFGRGATR